MSKGNGSMILTRTFIEVMMVVTTTGFAAASHVRAEEPADESAGSISQLLKSGWEIAGYASNSDNRSTFILFKKAGEAGLVQCLAGYDVTRSPRVFENCYRLQ
jgi:hypothetical protein